MSDKFLPDESEVSVRLKTLDAEKAGETSHVDHRWSTTIYSSSDIYQSERNSLAGKSPLCLGFVHELDSSPHSYVIREIWNTPWIVCRTANGGLAAFLNRCRHRGMRLLENAKGLCKKIVCPYHGWTYDDTGACVAIPQKAAAFPDLDLQSVRLESRRVAEHGGLLWILPDGYSEDLSEQFFGPLAKHFAAWGLNTYELRSSQTYDVSANWKILQDFYGPHSRAVYPLKRLSQDPDLKKAPLRRYTSVVYHVFPNTLISFQPFHALVSRFMPSAPDKTRAHISVLVRPEDAKNFSELVSKDIDFVTKGLLEDFSTAEKIQAGLAAGPDEFRAGSYEVQIPHFHKHLNSVQ